MNENQVIENESVAYDIQQAESGPLMATGWQFTWLCLLILSFCYELPVVKLTSMDRMNPRLFDIVFLLGMFTILPGIDRAGDKPMVYRVWSWIIAIFCVCAVAWIPFFPWYYGKYTIFYALKYIQGLLAIYMAFKIPLTAHQKKIIHILVVVGGIVVTLGAIPQYLRGGVGTFVSERTGEEVRPGLGVLFSTLGRGYFHIAMFSTVSSVMTFSLALLFRGITARLLCLALGVFVGWPAFVCGARSGVIAGALSWIVLFFLARASLKFLSFLAGIIVVISVFLFAPKYFSLEYLAEKSTSIRRLTEIKEEERVHASWFQFDVYKMQSWRIPFIGAGFYVAPVSLPDGSLRYRPGYGIHNDYLFPLEQGGLGAFAMFIFFLITCHKSLKQMRRAGPTDADKAFALGISAFFYALLPTMMAGQIFWHGFEKVNLNTYVILLFVLANTPSIPEEGESAYTDEEGLILS